MFEPTDEQWWAMCDSNMSKPVPLLGADLTIPFVYDREMGLFYVPFGYHCAAMATLLAFSHGDIRPFSTAEKLGLRYDPFILSDHWLEGEGRCFKSSVSVKVKAGKKGSLSFAELQVFGTVDYILEKN